MMRLGFPVVNSPATMLLPSFTPIHALGAEHVPLDLRNGRAHDASIFEKYHLEAVRDAQMDLSEAKSLCRRTTVARIPRRASFRMCGLGEE